MARRTKKIKNSLLKSETVGPVKKGKIFSGISFKLTKPKKAGGEKANLRFSVSLIILTAVLEVSLFILLLSLINAQTARGGDASFAAPAVKSAKKLVRPVNQKLNDPNLDFELNVPAQFGEWLYKIGYVKSLTDKSLSDQYLRIYIPLPGVKSSNFDQQNQEILTIRKFSEGEYIDIGKKCLFVKNKDEICDVVGEWIFQGPDSKGDYAAYAYTKPTDCSKNMNAKCSLAEKIIESFKLK